MEILSNSVRYSCDFTKRELLQNILFYANTSTLIPPATVHLYTKNSYFIRLYSLMNCFMVTIDNCYNLEIANSKQKK